MSKDPGYSDSKRDALESKVRQYQSTILELQEQVLVLGKLQDENSKLRDCVEFYAKQSNWMGYHRDVDVIRSCDCEPTKADEDGFDIILGGKRARQVLKELGENK